MKATGILSPAVLFVVALALGLIASPVPLIFAADPTAYPAGLPWGAGTPWPAATPLSVGQPVPAGASSYVAPVPPPPTVLPIAPPVMFIPPAAVPRQPAVFPQQPAVVPQQPAVAPPSVYVPLPVPIPVPTVVPVPASVQAGASGPAGALDISGNWQALGPNASVWYRIGYAGTSGVHMEVTLEADGADRVDLSIFAPNQLDNLDRPVGHGTRSNSGARLQWSGGGSNAVWGTWYARITNNNSSSIQYRLTSNQTQIAPKACFSYWEYLPTGQYINWNECQR